MKAVFWKILFVVCAMSLGMATQQLWAKFTKVQYAAYGTLLTKPRPMPPFTLEGTAGYPIDLDHLAGHWTYLFFGFTHCASICPVTMAELATMYRSISHHKNLPKPLVVMITLDPKRDDIKRMKDYVQSFHPEFVGASGGERDIQSLAHYLGVAYTYVKSNAQKRTDDYSIEHTGAIMLLNPRGELVAFFTPPHRAEGLVQDYQYLVHSLK